MVVVIQCRTGGRRQLGIEVLETKLVDVSLATVHT